MGTKTRFFVKILTFLLILSPSILVGQTRCESQVKYLWLPKEKPAVAPAAGENGEQAASGQKPEEVFFATVEMSGESEDAVKAKIGNRIPAEKERALQECRATHETKASCVAAKYAAMSGVLQTLDFKSRNELQKSVQHDCEMQSGRCVEATASDPQCRQAQAEQKEAAAAEAGKPGEAAKEEKGKKPTGGKKK